MLPAPGIGVRATGALGSGYAKGPDGKWAWTRPPAPGDKPNKPTNVLTRTPSEPTMAFFQAHTLQSSKHPAKDGKVEHSTIARNIVGEEFKAAGKDNGLEIWRIENMKAKPVPKEQHGKFYSGDAYIVLNTSMKASTYHIHYWIGKDSSQDKYATAAYKTVELDNHFTGGALQHRETQAQESDLFKSYFPDGLTYLEGGVASSFRHVKREEFSTRLLRLKGRRDVRVKQMEVSYTSLNKGDTFVLDTGRLLFQLNGPSANRAERVKGVELIRTIKDNERGGRAQIIVIDYHDDVKLNDNKKLTQFWEALGSKGEIAAADTAGDDVEYEKIVDTQVHVLRIKEEGSKIETSDVTERPLKKELLDSHNCYILDTDNEVFCWIGKATSLPQKNAALKQAQAVHQQKPKWVQLLRVVQGAEPPLLKEKFVNWRALVPKNLDFSSDSNYLPRTGGQSRQDEEIDVSQLFTPITGVPQPDKGFLHDGTGTSKVWRIDEFKKVEVPEAAHGVFFEEECYLCMYAEVKDKKRSHYVYFWQGRRSPMEFRGASALMAKEMADTVRGKCLQFRIAQGKEPEHFLMLFRNKKSAVIGGQNVSGAARDNVYPVVVGQGLHRGRDGYVGLYHVKQIYLNEDFEWNTKAVQVPTAVSSLNSNDAFVLFGKDGKCFVWYGTGCSPAERRVARAVAGRLVGDANVGRILVIEESKEPGYFWTYLEGGEDVEKVRSLYPNANHLKRPSLAVRLFVCSNTTGTFKVAEIPNFTQEDLDNDDVFMLDCFAEVFLWVGKGANENEKRLAMQTALAYVTQGVEKVGRPVDTPIYYVQAGEEPLQFTCHFLAWDSTLLAPPQNPEISDFIITKPKPLLSSRSSSSITPRSTSQSSLSSTSASSAAAVSAPVSVAPRTPTAVHKPPPAFPRSASQNISSTSTPTVSVTVGQGVASTTSGSSSVTIEVNISEPTSKEGIKSDNDSKSTPQESIVSEGTTKTADKGAVEVQAEIKVIETINKDTQIGVEPVKASEPITSAIKDNQPESTQARQAPTDADTSNNAPKEAAPSASTPSASSNNSASATSISITTSVSTPATTASSSAPQKVVLTKKDGSILKIDPTHPKKFIVFAKRAGTLPIKTEERKVPSIEVKAELVKTELEKYNKQFYTYEELSAKKKPPGVDATVLEKYLQDDEFEKRFEMTKVAFYALPHWKRITLRKKAQLF